MTNLPPEMMKAAMAPLKTQPKYQIGSLVRVKDAVINDGQTPEYWGGAVCVVESRKAVGMLTKQWFYVLRHKNGSTCGFYEYELIKAHKRRSDRDE